MEIQKEPNSEVLIAHMADLHLRDSQYASTKRGQDFFDGVLNAVQAAIDAGADLLVAAGDIFDKPRPSAKVIGQLIKLDRMLKARGKLMFAGTGNHDWGNPTWLLTLFEDEYADGAEIPENTVGIVPIDGRTLSFRGIKFAGINPHSVSSFRSNLAAITVEARDADVVIYHGLVTGIVPMYAGGDPLRVEELPVSMHNKAWLLGDIHVQGYVERDRPGGGKCLIGYPGATEVCNASEAGQKSVPLIRVSKTSAEVMRKVPFATRPFIAMDVHTEAELEELMTVVAAQADQHPVVSVKFDRSLPQTIGRLHSVLDAQRSIIRCYPLPKTDLRQVRGREVGERTDKTVADFIMERFKEREDLCALSLDLFHRDSDAASIIADFVQRRIDAINIREED